MHRIVPRLARFAALVAVGADLRVAAVAGADEAR
jgi:hypothetical protein